MAQKSTEMAARDGISYSQAYRQLRLANDTMAARQFSEAKMQVDHDLARAAQSRLALDVIVGDIMKRDGCDYPTAYATAVKENPQHARNSAKQLKKVPPAPGEVKAASELGQRPGESADEWRGRLCSALESVR
jgi:hypothetical protein